MFRSKSESFPFTWRNPPPPHHQLEPTAGIPQVSINAEAVILSITEDYKFLIFLISYTVAQLKYKHTLPPDCKSPSTRHSAHRQKGQDEFCKAVVHPLHENWFTRLQKKKKKTQEATEIHFDSRALWVCLFGLKLGNDLSLLVLLSFMCKIQFSAEMYFLLRRPLIIWCAGYL